MARPEEDAAPVEIAVRRLPGAEDLPLPAYQTEDAAGMDLHAAVVRPREIDSGGIALVPTGIAMALPRGYEAQLRPRSGLALNHGISLPNAPATIDADYRGEIRVIVINHGPKPFTVTRGLRIAQMVVQPVVRATWREIDELPPSDRGGGGFGHTGR